MLKKYLLPCSNKSTQYAEELQVVLEKTVARVPGNRDNNHLQRLACLY